MTKRFMSLFALALLAPGFSLEAKAQWLDGKVAVKTNGNNFQSGDRLKVELLPLDLINERFYTQVSYRFNETVEEKDEDGKVTKKQVEKKIEMKWSLTLTPGRTQTGPEPWGCRRINWKGWPARRSTS